MTARTSTARTSTARTSAPRPPARGIGLPDALLALALFTLALTGALRWQAIAAFEASVARERSEAVELAQDDLESQRAFGSLEPAPGRLSFADITSAGRTVQGLTTRFALHRQVTPDPDGPGKSLVVTVGWADRTGAPRAVTLRTFVDPTLPEHAMALVAPAGLPSQWTGPPLPLTSP